MSSDNSKEAIQEHIRVYMMVFGALAVLTVITVLASFLKVSTSEAIFLALIIASVKASLVAGYFMHLVSEKSMIISILLLTVFFFFIMIFLIKSHISQLRALLDNSIISSQISRLFIFFAHSIVFL